MLPLLLINSIRWRPILRVALCMAVFLLCVYCYLQHVALKQNQLVYMNPAIVRQIRTVRVDGPVRIVTRVIETPGRIERETVEERGPVSVVQDSLSAQFPVFPPAPRSDRWLVGLSIDPLSFKDSQRFGGYIGYGFFNRLDLLCGYSENDKPVAMIVFRF